MWTVIYVTQKIQEVEKLKLIFGENGVISRVRENIGSNDGGRCYEILVPARELSVAQNLIIESEI